MGFTVISYPCQPVSYSPGRVCVLFLILPTGGHQSAAWLDNSLRKCPGAGWNLFWFDVNSLWPSDTIWHHGTWSTLVQVMACCLMAPSHYLNQC